MYQIYADDELIYDSGSMEYKIGKGVGSLEVNKSGSFTFSVYSDHFFYDRFVKLKTVIVVKKSGHILFRGRVFDEQIGYWKEKILTCEGEMGFLQDSIIRPYDFSGAPNALFNKFVNEHNVQVDEFKQFRLGKCTVTDANDYIARSNSAYETALSNMNSRLIDDSTGGYLHITHGDDGTDPVPTLNYLADFERVSTQTIEFGKNLRDFVKKSSGQEMATAIIPLGARLDDGERMTIAGVNNGVDYVYDEKAVSLYGWVFKVVVWDDVTIPENLKTKALACLQKGIQESITLNLNAIDLHLWDKTTDSFRLGDYVKVVSPPHNFDKTMLCTRMTFDILKPENDTVTLGVSYSSFIESSVQTSTNVGKLRDDLAGVRLKTARDNLSNLIAASFGLFKTEQFLQDGSIVYYLHDRPELSDSVNIWKMTGSAFAVSSNGGKTWSAGMDADGNTVLNILAAVGVDASWIKADNLSAISAKIGFWDIRNDAIYKEYTNPTSGFIYRIWIQPPDHWFDSDGIRPFIQIDVSEDGGATFSNYVTFSENRLTFSAYVGGVVKYEGSLNHTEMYVTNKKTGSSLFANTSVGWFDLRNMKINVDGEQGISKEFTVDTQSGKLYMKFRNGILVKGYVISGDTVL